MDMENPGLNTSHSINMTNLTNKDANFTIEQDSHQMEECENFLFAMFVVVVSVLTLFGVCGNIVCVIVLHREKTNKSTNFLLQSLAVADTMLLLVGWFVLAIVLGVIKRNASWSTYLVWGSLTRVIFDPLSNICISLVIWNTVLLAINR